VEYFDNGRISEEGYKIRQYYGDGLSEWLQTGTFTNYYPNGNKRLEGEYDSKKRQIGKWVYYNEDGSIKEIEEYASGQRRTTGYKDGVAGPTMDRQDIACPSWVPGGFPVDVETPEGLANRELRERMYQAYVKKIKAGVFYSDARRAVYKEFNPQWKPRLEKDVYRPDSQKNDATKKAGSTGS
jgi:antitoxin component YwqK of YwqJK toxin-antitoxin module